MLLSNMPGVNIECFQEYEKRIVKAEDRTMANLEHISRAKGLILIVASKTSSTNQAQLLLDEVIEICKTNSNTPSELVIAGGIARNILRAQKVFHKTEVLGVTFNGENVTVHGDIHVPHKMVLEEFMQAFSKRVGKIPEGCLRMAFAFICINRKDTYRDINLFKEYFPGVPIYGFYSYGEFFLQGLKGETSRNAKRNAAYSDDENYFYTDSSSFLIVTLRKSKATTVTSNK
uniref:FIST_C domain-containing protein n=2 Tax=Rhodnius prolixus TaxID=13249 RepID=T1I929_RHOPR